MEIRVRTADEFRDAHVVIEVRAEEGEDVRVRPLVADGYPSELDWAAVRAERDEARERAARRERKIEELTAELAEQRQRADANQAWAERAEGRVSAYGLDLSATQRKLADAERAIQILSAQLRVVAEAVYQQDVNDAVQRVYESKGPRAMAEAIRAARSAAAPPVYPAEPTLQA